MLETMRGSGSIVDTTQKLFARRGARTLLCGVSTYGVKVIEFQSLYESRKLNEIIFYSKKFITFASKGTQMLQNKALAFP